jgi:SAM-dependent methyltransferase
MSAKKNPPEFYGKDYLDIEIGGAGGAKRKEDNGAYYQAGVFMKRFLDHAGIETPRTLDVGCGLGYVVRHLRNQGVDAHGCEYGRWPQENAVVEGILWADLTDFLPYEPESFDLVSCLGVLSQFPQRFALKALKELMRVSRGFVWVNIQCEKHELQAHHKNIKEKEFWFSLFKTAGLEIVEEEFLLSHYHRVPERLNRILKK